MRAGGSVALATGARGRGLCRDTMTTSTTARSAVPLLECHHVNGSL